MNLSVLLRITRWPNVLMTVVTQLVIVFFFYHVGIDTTLADWQIGLLITATALLTASGNIINDVYDVVIDQINKPEKVIVGKKITEKTAMSWYMGLTIAGVAMGFVLANSIDRPLFSCVFIIVAFLLYLYASSLKSMLLVGNVVISILVSLVLLVVVIFDLLPSVSAYQREFYQSVLKVVAIYAAFSFLVNLCREWVKDCQDVNGDKAGGRSTLPLLLGVQRTQRIIAGTIGIVIALLIYLTIEVIHADQWLLYYVVFGIIAPLMYVAIRLWQATGNKELSSISAIIKITMLLGVLSMLLVHSIV